jgi:hypothetical protein
MKLKSMLKKKSKKEVDEYVGQNFREGEKVMIALPRQLSPRNEVITGQVTKKISTDAYWVVPDKESLGKLGSALSLRIKDGFQADANQLKKQSTLSMTGLNP